MLAICPHVTEGGIKLERYGGRIEPDIEELSSIRRQEGGMKQEIVLEYDQQLRKWNGTGYLGVEFKQKTRSRDGTGQFGVEFDPERGLNVRYISGME
jgi:hypothetical protein